MVRLEKGKRQANAITDLVDKYWQHLEQRFFHQLRRLLYLPHAYTQAADSMCWGGFGHIGSFEYSAK